MTTLHLRPVPRQPLTVTPSMRAVMEDLRAGRVVSWTFVPSNGRKALKALLAAKLVTLTTVTLPGETREYENVVLTPYGQQVIDSL